MRFIDYNFNINFLDWRLSDIWPPTSMYLLYPKYSCCLAFRSTLFKNPDLIAKQVDKVVNYKIPT